MLTLLFVLKLWATQHMLHEKSFVDDPSPIVGVVVDDGVPF